MFRLHMYDATADTNAGMCVSTRLNRQQYVHIYTVRHSRSLHTLQLWMEVLASGVLALIT